jgi:hypothetical protein
MANGVINSNEGAKAGNDFRQAASVSSRSMKSIAAFLGGMLLFAFSGAANVATVSAHSSPSAPSSDAVNAMEKQYPDATSMRLIKRPDFRTGLHEAAENGTLGMIKDDIAKDLRPDDFGRLDGPEKITERDEKTGRMIEKPNSNRRRVIDLFVMNPSASFAKNGIKALVRAYSETLDAQAQLKLASLAVDNKILDMVSISKLSPEDIIKPTEARIPLPPEAKVATGGDVKKSQDEGTERFRIVKTNLLLDALHKRQNVPELQALANRLTPEQKVRAMKAVNEFGESLGHYWAQDRNVEMLVNWKKEIDWSAPDNSKVTPLAILAKDSNALSAVFDKDDPQLAAAVVDPANRNAREDLVVSHRILQLSDGIIRAAVTPDFLLGPSVNGGGTVMSKLKPECLVAYFSPRVMGHWTPTERKNVWAEVRQEFQGITAVRDAYFNVMKTAKATPAPALSANALNLH